MPVRRPTHPSLLSPPPPPSGAAVCTSAKIPTMQALEFALFLTYGVPSISKLLHKTGEFRKNVGKRWDRVGQDSTSSLAAIGTVRTSHMGRTSVVKGVQGVQGSGRRRFVSRFFVRGFGRWPVLLMQGPMTFERPLTRKGPKVPSGNTICAKAAPPHANNLNRSLEFDWLTDPPLSFLLRVKQTPS